MLRTSCPYAAHEQSASGVCGRRVRAPPHHVPSWHTTHSAERAKLVRAECARWLLLCASPLRRARMGAELIIEARDLKKTYITGTQRVEALRGIQFAVQRGEMVAIMGP